MRHEAVYSTSKLPRYAIDAVFLSDLQELMLRHARAAADPDSVYSWIEIHGASGKHGKHISKGHNADILFSTGITNPDKVEVVVGAHPLRHNAPNFHFTASFGNNNDFIYAKGHADIAKGVFDDMMRAIDLHSIEPVPVPLTWANRMSDRFLPLLSGWIAYCTAMTLSLLGFFLLLAGTGWGFVASSAGVLLLLSWPALRLMKANPVLPLPSSINLSRDVPSGSSLSNLLKPETQKS